MEDFDKPKAVDTSTLNLKEKKVTTPKSTQEAQDALDAANKDTRKNLNNLKTAIDAVKVKDGVKKFTEALDSNIEYKKQVEQILGRSSWESRSSTEIKGDIQTLQHALGVKEDSALGPNTFDALKTRWEISQLTNPQTSYTEFINNLMGRANINITPIQIEDPTKPINVTPIQIDSPQASTEPVSTTEGTAPKNEKSDFGAIFDSASVETEDGTAAINFELDGMVIDRDARSIIDHKDQGTYELNIGWKGENVVIDKKALNVAIKNNSETVSGETKVWKKPISIIINKEITEKTPFKYDKAWLEKGIISQGNVNYNFEFKRWDLRNFGTDPDVSSITEKGDNLSFNTKDKELMTLSKGQFEEAVKVMNNEGKNSTTVNSIIINKEKGEWKKPDAPITAGGDNSSTTTT